MHISNQKLICEKCNRLISKLNYNRHIKVCGTIKIKSPKKIRGVDYDPNIGFKLGTRVIWNKGLTKKDHVSLILNRPDQKGSNGFFYGHLHTTETKEKISISRKNYLSDNPEKVPYKLNHSSKQSYPEKYFEEILLKHNLIFEKEYRINLYSLDFAFIDKKIDLEINGDQHYLDEKIIKSDIIRNDFLKNLGWKIIRIKWSDYKKLNLDNKTKFINDLIIELNSILPF